MARLSQDRYLSGVSRSGLSIFLLFVLSLPALGGCGGGRAGTNAGSVTVKGLVIDSLGQALSGIEMSDAGGDGRATSDSNGRFTIDATVISDSVTLIANGEGLPENASVSFKVASGVPVVSRTFVIDDGEIFTDTNDRGLSSGSDSDPITEGNLPSSSGDDGKKKKKKKKGGLPDVDGEVINTAKQEEGAHEQNQEDLQQVDRGGSRGPGTGGGGTTSDEPNEPPPIVKLPPDAGDSTSTNSPGSGGGISF